MKSTTLIQCAFAAVVLVGCGGGEGGQPEASGGGVDTAEETGTGQGPADHGAGGSAIAWDQVPWRSDLTVSTETWENREAVVPPQCYTRTEERFNPCFTCHQTYPGRERPNYMDDGFLQGDYAFSPYAMTNHWKNLFVDRSDAVAAIPDGAIRDYVAENNYTPLREKLQADRDYSGYIPDLKNLHQAGRAFDDQGFARDGSGWVAFNYKPLPSTFWPTNGSTDDVMIRLPEAFRTAQQCSSIGATASRDVYLANLSILEMAIKGLDRISTPPIDEAKVCGDLNGDGDATDRVTAIQGRPARYVGQASGSRVHEMLYPEGTELLHTVRYVGAGERGEIGPTPRMKEVRYMRKIRFYGEAQLRSLYGNEHQEKIDGNLPKFTAAGEGLDNGFGWKVLGFIADEDGALRLQTREEHRFCMGCHATTGSTIDQTFAFPRKVTGAQGWGYIDLQGMADAPAVGESQGEILQYLRRVGGGSEFRENAEMEQKWFDGQGKVLADKVRAADVAELITPSADRALRLNKAYRVIVKNQTFVHGRDATVEPAENVYEEVPADAAPLPESRHYGYDLRLDWGQESP